ncbi:MoxR family ATPase, partial [Candidatus Pacearchaeota archaeon]
QSALIEAMQERQVTIGRETFPLPKPFFVMASQNPLESEGVYPLPEAQLDRFIFKIVFSYPSRADEMKVLEKNLNFMRFEELGLRKVLNPNRIVELQSVVHKVYFDEKVKHYLLDIVERTRKKDFHFGKYIEIGASPRASISMFIAAKAEALLRGRNYVIPDDVAKVAFDVLRHRVLLSYSAHADGVDEEKIIREILASTKVR